MKKLPPNTHGRCHILKDWPEWDPSVHESEEQIVRQGRAKTYDFDYVQIDEAYCLGKFSSTSDLPFYIATLSQCDCYDFQRRHLPCKHIYRLAIELGIIELINRPATRAPGTGYTADELGAIREMEDPDTHPEQIKRMESARKIKADKIELHREQRSAIFAGSGKTPYITTEKDCTCRDYVLRKLPCKHIYRLRMELGGEK